MKPLQSDSPYQVLSTQDLIRVRDLFSWSVRIGYIMISVNIRIFLQKGKQYSLISIVVWWQLLILNIIGRGSKWLN